MEKRANVPIYVQISDELKRRIIEKKYVFGEFLPSERLLCEEFSVERATVRRSLELLVKEKLLTKIPGSGTKVVLDLSQNKNIGMENENYNIAFVLPSNTIDKITQPFNAGVFYHLEKECKREKYNLIYTGLTSDGGLSGILASRNLKGIIWMSRLPESYIKQAQQMGIASVLISNSIPGFTSILVDNIEGSFQATDYLIKLGHRQIAFINGKSSYINAIERFDGFKRALSSNGIELEQDYIIEGGWTFEGGYAAMASILKLHNKPTAVYAANDIMALGAVKAIREAGLDIPKDFSIIGFDDIEQGKYLSPPLSTISTDLGLIARQCMKNLIEIINDDKFPSLKIVIPVNLVVRESARDINES